MKFKEFVAWCNARACDGCWGMQESQMCIAMIHEVYKKPFWKREKFWEKEIKDDICRIVVEPTNKLIRERYGADVRLY